jgi:hypothetical protein
MEVAGLQIPENAGIMPATRQSRKVLQEPHGQCFAFSRFISKISGS